MTLAYYMDGVASLTLCLVGVVINLYAVCTLFKQRLGAIFHKLMLSLVIYDLLYVTFNIFFYSLANLSEDYSGKTFTQFSSASV